MKSLQPVELVLIGSADSAASRVWNELMDQHHYLGRGPLCGAQLRYLVRSEPHGWLGGVSFSAAAWRLQARDQWIGWNDAARQQNLHRVVCNSRLLIAPHVQVPHLASHVLGLALGRVAADFRDRYGYEPVLVETFIERERFAGTCYRAANFIEVGETQARGRQDRAHQAGGSVKRVLVYELHEQARERLREGPLSAARPRAVAADRPGDWGAAGVWWSPLGSALGSAADGDWAGFLCPSAGADSAGLPNPGAHQSGVSILCTRQDRHADAAGTPSSSHLPAYGRAEGGAVPAGYDQPELQRPSSDRESRPDRRAGGRRYRLDGARHAEF
ncbi:MAG: DUF4338 domain-containing protein [Gammaproteobacteria bacterium]|nr:DUF4338 domain-containing protein [Gammaproteobacteria bacterium]